MGIIINDEVGGQYGDSINDTYGCYHDCDIFIKKTDTGINIKSKAKIFVTKNARTEQKIPLMRVLTQGYIATEDLATTDLFTVLYADLKSKYTNTTDDI